ncbi:DUF2750 domain-containing protein [Ramlibacter albus]|uniref:DUF2750 domain-containing protein n=1 Tax=Ramlibacter albus TaxID=2079448 RepID=A0A923MF78_9BURK|nr:DUF2750 domain-containing protein [Ramlibacter albus]MBC5768491.1 DUF2750 domain-containing protein [Ramlibacter albus]
MTKIPKSFEAVLRLQGPKRFEHFVKVVADREQAWGLFQDGWALAADDEGFSVFPLWPAAEYAELCARDEWRNYAPKPVSVEVLMGELLPRLEREKVLPGVFYTPENKGVTIRSEELAAALEAELSKY